MIGFAVTGSFCTHKKAIKCLETLVFHGYDVIPIASENVKNTDTRFGKADDFIKKLEDISHKKCVSTIVDSERFGPAQPLDALIIAPCTGNTLAKIALGITDTCVTMAAKAHMRSSRKLLIALATNDAMSSNLRNIGTLITKQNVFFVPMLQDDPIEKPHSLVCDFDSLFPAFEKMLNGEQIRPIFR